MKRRITPAQFYQHVDHRGGHPATWPWWLLAIGIAIGTWGIAHGWIS